MSKLEVVSDCPLGSRCEEVKDNKIHRCMWYMNVKGVHPQTGEELDQWGCAMAWIPILSMEASQQTRQAGAAIESFRNEMVRGQHVTNQLMNSALKQKVAEIDITPEGD